MACKETEKINQQNFPACNERLHQVSSIKYQVSTISYELNLKFPNQLSEK